MKHLLTTLLSTAALFAAASGAAEAAVIPVPLSLPTQPGNGAPMIGTFVDTLSTAGSFSDSFVFNAPAPWSIDDFSVQAGAGVAFSGMTLTFYGLPNQPLGLNTATFSPTAINASYEGQLVSGLYELTVSGTASANAQFTGSITAFPLQTTAPVPEPASWATLLLGLGITGALARRRTGR